MLSKKQIVLGTIGIVGAALVILTQTAGSDAGTPAANKLEGAWVSTVSNLPLSWITTFSPADASGRRATMTSSLLVPVPAELLIPGLPQFDVNSAAIGPVEITGPDTAQFTAIGYSLQNTIPSQAYPFEAKVGLIWVTSGTVKRAGPGRSHTTLYIAYYLPSADVNPHDGIPDAGAVPIACLGPTVTDDVRVDLMPHCVPPAVGAAQ